MTVITQCQICNGFHIDGCPNLTKGEKQKSLTPVLDVFLKLANKVGIGRW